MEAIIKYVVGEMGVVAQAPVTFAAALLILSAAIWWVMDWRYSGVIAHRDAEITTLKTERDAYRNNAGGASPVEVKAKLDELAEMSRYTIGAKWAPLTSAEIKSLGAKLSMLPSRRIQVMYSNYRGKELAQTFVDALKDGGWTEIMFSEGGGLGYGIVFIAVGISAD